MPLTPLSFIAAAVEYALLSTTTNRDTAIQYSGVDKQRGAVMQIQAGRVDLGASIQASDA